MVTVQPPVERLASLGAALDAVADAALRADSDALGVCEGALAAATALMPTADELSGVDVATLRGHLQHIKDALSRCRAIGSATSELVTVTLAAQGMAPGYLPAGVGAPAPRLGRLEARV